ncbi:hypothetical protein BCV71DRAFT_276876, partial [Rhizopus microsporus]
EAPPVRLHRSAIDRKPIFNYISSLDGPSISLSRFQIKLAFLLGVTCFLRPSDLHRIPFSSTKVTNTGSLYFEVHCPKEKRQRQRIIKFVRTVQHWIHKLVRISTAEPRVTLWSIASSLALKAGIPKDDTVTMGN